MKNDKKELDWLINFFEEGKGSFGDSIDDIMFTLMSKDGIEKEIITFKELNERHCSDNN